MPPISVIVYITSYIVHLVYATLMIQYILVISVIFHENYTHKLLTIMVDLLSLKVKVKVMCMIILSPLEGSFFKSLMQ